MINYNDTIGKVDLSPHYNVRRWDIAVNNAIRAVKSLIKKEVYEVYDVVDSSLSPEQLDVKQLIKDLIVYHSYLNYVRLNGITDTPSGLRVHTNDYSETLNSDEFGAVISAIKEQLKVAEYELLLALGNSCKIQDREHRIGMYRVGANYKSRNRFSGKK